MLPLLTLYTYCELIGQHVCAMLRMMHVTEMQQISVKRIQTTMLLTNQLFQMALVRIQHFYGKS